MSDLRKFCFENLGPDDSPEKRLVEWMSANLTEPQRLEVRRLWAELFVDGVHGVTGEYMLAIVEVAKVNADPEAGPLF